MFENIASKIKILAKVFCWIGIIAFVILGIVLMSIDESMILMGVLTMIIGPLLSWISCFTLYGLGQLIENTDTIIYYNNILQYNQAEYFNRNKPANADSNSSSQNSQAKTDKNGTPNTWKCYRCGQMIHEYPCSNCGYPINKE